MGIPETFPPSLFPALTTITTQNHHAYSIHHTPAVDRFPPPPPTSHQLAVMSSSSNPQPAAPARTFTNPPGYSFAHHRLAPTLRDASKTPVVLVACGSFSPVTYLHLRMFEMAIDYVRQNTEFEIVGGYLSPVSDMYKKPGLLSATHR